MLQPPGFIDSTSSHLVCKLKKALYGLKQAPRAWYSTFSSILLSSSFNCSHCDSSLFIHLTSSSLLLVLVYVDDILVTGNTSQAISSLVHEIHTAFSIKDLGSISFFLGLTVAPKGHGYSLTQTKYAAEILAKAAMLNYKRCASPLATVKPTVSTSPPFSQPSLYCSIVGGLQYLTITRPDLAFAVNQACQHMAFPTEAHFSAVKRLLRYVKGTLDHGLFFSPRPFSLQAFSDSDWAEDPLDRRSTSGPPLRLNISSAHCVAEISWHIEIDYHFVREKVAAKQVVLKHISSEDQLADVFTKPLSTSRFHYLKNKLMVNSSPISLRVDIRYTAPMVPSQPMVKPSQQRLLTEASECTLEQL
ncbi:uncharacterized mitochondrial protein AtMg00810-like [Rhododendron vialii]|uniref:uncharacterized mitochondrial protein AtMg00810-like n=1 Tax=Rhododendron vialii TaxID=182163 RepID=UPI00265E8C83|nr:uncharacterized mitochondrial protein AtMg00810-like [Rhododendron vialii]